MNAPPPCAPPRRSSVGPKILEVNSSPGLEGVERTSGKDVAGMIVEYIEDHVRPIARKTVRRKKAVAKPAAADSAS